MVTESGCHPQGSKYSTKLTMLPFIHLFLIVLNIVIKRTTLYYDMFNIIPVTNLFLCSFDYASVIWTIIAMYKRVRKTHRSREIYRFNERYCSICRQNYDFIYHNFLATMLLMFVWHEARCANNAFCSWRLDYWTATLAHLLFSVIWGHSWALWEYSIKIRKRNGKICHNRFFLHCCYD